MKYLEVKLLDCMEVLFLFFEEPAFCFLSAVSPKCILVSTATLGLLFPVFFLLALLMGELMPHCGFDLHFPGG